MIAAGDRWCFPWSAGPENQGILKTSYDFFGEGDYKLYTQILEHFQIWASKTAMFMWETGFSLNTWSYSLRRAWL